MPSLVRQVWDRRDILVLMPPGAGHSVRWFFDDGVFDGWYVSLELPCTRRGRRRHHRPGARRGGAAGSALGLEGRGRVRGADR